MGDMDRNLERIKDARDRGLITDDQATELTRSALGGSVGERQPADQRPTSTPAVQRAIERTTQSESSTLRVTRPSGSVELCSGDHAAGGSFEFAVDPRVTPLAQPSVNVCWAAAGAMLLSWRERQSLTIPVAADLVGGDWRSKLDNDECLTLADVDA